MSATTLPKDRLAFTIREFCAAIGISHNCFYRLPPEGRPSVICVGRRRLITADDARAWLAAAPRAGGKAAPLPPPPRC